MTREDLSSWLDAYGRAWEQRDPDAAAALFTEDATYQWGPFGPTYSGPDEIRGAWERATGTQQDIHFGYEVIAVEGAVGVARWWVSCLLPAHRLRSRDEGIFAISLDAERRCKDFREWWNSVEEPA